MAVDKKLAEELKTLTLKLAADHAKKSEEDAPDDVDDLEMLADDMWWDLALPEFESNKAYKELDINDILDELEMQAVYNEKVVSELKKKFGM
jgi:hypothetical protein